MADDERVVINFEGELLAMMRIAATKGEVDITTWVADAIRYKIAIEESANSAIAEYLIKIGHPRIFEDGVESLSCPDCSSREFSAGGEDGDVTCLLCGKTLIKCPPEWHEFVALHRDGAGGDEGESRTFN